MNTVVHHLKMIYPHLKCTDFDAVPTIHPEVTLDELRSAWEQIFYLLDDDSDGFISQKDMRLTAGLLLLSLVKVTKHMIPVFVARISIICDNLKQNSMKFYKEMDYLSENKVDL